MVLCGVIQIVKMAMLNNRKFIGIEKNKEYFDKSLERFKKYKLEIEEYIQKNLVILLYFYIFATKIN